MEHSHLETFDSSAILLNNHFLVYLSIIMNGSFDFFLIVFYWFVTQV